MYISFEELPNFSASALLRDWAAYMEPHCCCSHTSHPLGHPQAHKDPPTMATTLATLYLTCQTQKRKTDGGAGKWKSPDLLFWVAMNAACAFHAPAK